MFEAGDADFYGFNSRDARSFQSSAQGNQKAQLFVGPAIIEGFPAHNRLAIIHPMSNQVGEAMKTLIKTILVGAVLAMAGVAMAAGAADAVVGSWTLNVAKSTFDSGPAPKSQARTYTEDKDGTSVTVTGVGADGSAISQKATFKYDGKPYSMTGSPDFDTLSLKRVNGSTVTAVLMKGGKKVGNTTRTISEHGKVMTLSTKIAGADGKQHSTVLVFDKQ